MNGRADWRQQDSRLTLIRAMSELTPLQQAFSKSRAGRRVFREEITREAGGSGWGQLTDTLLADIAAYMSDNLIADVLYYALQCDDITPAERKEIAQILDLV